MNDFEVNGGEMNGSGDAPFDGIISFAVAVGRVSGVGSVYPAVLVQRVTVSDRILPVLTRAQLFGGAAVAGDAATAGVLRVVVRSNASVHGAVNGSNSAVGNAASKARVRETLRTRYSAGTLSHATARGEALSGATKANVVSSAKARGRILAGGVTGGASVVSRALAQGRVVKLQKAAVYSSGVAEGSATGRLRAARGVRSTGTAIGIASGTTHIFNRLTDEATGRSRAFGTHSASGFLVSRAAGNAYASDADERAVAWVLHIDTTGEDGPLFSYSEYAFDDTQPDCLFLAGGVFYVGCRDGLYRMSPEGTETVNGFVQTGRTDFGDDRQKRVTHGYANLSADVPPSVGVVTDTRGAPSRFSYPIDTQTGDGVGDAATHMRRFNVGRGLEARHWQFDISTTGRTVIDEFGVQVMPTTRRV